jgi:hypothetical protein
MVFDGFTVPASPAGAIRAALHELVTGLGRLTGPSQATHPPAFAPCPVCEAGGCSRGVCAFNPWRPSAQVAANNSARPAVDPPSTWLVRVLQREAQLKRWQAGAPWAGLPHAQGDRYVA